MAKADYETAKARYPSTQMGEREWVSVFDANPDIMWAIIGDVYDAVKTEQEKDAGVRRMGRRPAREATSMAEVYATVFPLAYSHDPFPEALAKLLNGRSQRAFAQKVPCGQATIWRLLTDREQPDLDMLERVARAAKVPPYFFLEYRALFIGQMITRTLLGQPSLSITAMKRVRALETPS